MFENINSSLLIFLTGVFLSCFFSICIVLTKPLHNHLTADTLTGVQKVHNTLTPRVGGIAIIAGLIFLIVFAEYPEYLLLIILTGFPVFLAGLGEDIFKSISSFRRLIAAMISAILFCFFSKQNFTSSGIYFIDETFVTLHLWPFVTVIAIAALTNSINFIDGFNGLASGASMLMAFCLYVLATVAGDFVIMQLCMIFIAVLLGFFVVNFPRGFLFLGDSGSYFCGFFLAAISILLINRNPEIPPLVLLVVFAYPIVELLFSIYRKTKRKGHRADQPDKVHLHMLVFRSRGRLFSTDKVNQNAATGAMMLIFPLASLAVILLFSLTRGTSLLFLIVFTLAYLRLYKRLSLN